jgi:hypothetical protein
LRSPCPGIGRLATEAASISEAFARRSISFDWQKQTMTARRVTHRHRTAQLNDPVIITVVGKAFPIPELLTHLPARWRIRHLHAVGAAVSPDAIVIGQPTTDAVRRLHAGYPSAEVVAVVTRSAPISDVVALLDAGAGACVREGRPDLLAGHLRSRIRRTQPAPQPA